ncbi:MAG: LysM peptidoglycan-binding domain-containing protein [Gammaproteobacteria bacterium]|nr:LysM peptidoglycan-binding domain-containing protein [Gammaproteobacteria bacterium]
MKLFKGLRTAALVALVLGIAVGCASTPEPEPVDDQFVVAQRAIADAKAANAEALAAGASWRDTDLLIAQAEEALRAGDTGKAIQLANQARRQAENALKQMRDQMAKEAADAAARTASDTYAVVSGDTLWGISAKSSIYGNPYQWPLIFKANRSQIKDADLIFPGQNFTIRRDAAASEVDAAVNHARTRGAWSLGVVEASDEAYLAR